MKAFLEVLTSTSSLAAAVANNTAYYTTSQFIAPFTATEECEDTDYLVDINPQGPAYSGNVLGYDYSLYSYVGCRCDSGYDHVYTVQQATGKAQNGCIRVHAFWVRPHIHRGTGHG